MLITRYNGDEFIYDEVQLVDQLVDTGNTIDGESNLTTNATTSSASGNVRTGLQANQSQSAV
jgi:hypothetical protein